MSTHTCPAPGCAREVDDELLACREHWYALPKPLRDALWRAYNDHGRGSPAHTAAVDTCLRALEQLAGARAPSAERDAAYVLRDDDGVLHLPHPTARRGPLCESAAPLIAAIHPLDRGALWCRRCLLEAGRHA